LVYRMLTHKLKQDSFRNLTMYSCVQGSSNSCTSTQVTHAIDSKSTETESTRVRDASVGSSSKVFGFFGFDSVQTNENAMTGLTGVSLTIFSILLKLVPDYQPKPDQLQR
jgi:hypothetical protein